jgi:hypothetical protein
MFGNAVSALYTYISNLLCRKFLQVSKYRSTGQCYNLVKIFAEKIGGFY